MKSKERKYGSFFNYIKNVPDEANVIGKAAPENLDVLTQVKVKKDADKNNYRLQAIEKIKKLTCLDSLGASQKLNTIINRIPTSPYTINLPLELFVDNNFIQNDVHASGWNLPKKIHTEEYLKQRGETEEYFFGYSYQNALKMATQYDDPSHLREKSLRPVYAALNITNSSKGSAPGYGLAYFKLKPMIKYRATIIPDDSLNVYAFNKSLAGIADEDVNEQRIETDTCYFDEYEKIVCLMYDEMLEKLLKNKPIGDHYIEVQVHGKLEYGSDVEELVLVEADDSASDEGAKPLNQFLPDEQAAIITHAKEFAKKHNIRAVILKQDGLEEILHEPVSIKAPTQNEKLDSVIPNYLDWKKLSYQFAVKRSNETLFIDTLIEQYTDLKDSGNLTTRLLAVIELEEHVSKWLELKKGNSNRSDSMESLLTRVKAEHKNLMYALSEKLNEQITDSRGLVV